MTEPVRLNVRASEREPMRISNTERQGESDDMVVAAGGADDH